MLIPNFLTVYPIQTLIEIVNCTRLLHSKLPTNEYTLAEVVHVAFPFLTIEVNLFLRSLLTCFLSG